MFMQVNQAVLFLEVNSWVAGFVFLFLKLINLY